jgi:serpin B
MTRNIVCALALAGMVGAAALMVGAAKAGVSIAAADGSPGQAAAAEAPAAKSEEASSARCGPAHEFEKRKMAAEAARAKAGFALDLLARVSQKSPNASVSPFGVSAVLATLDLGADPAMRSAIAVTLHMASGAGKIEDLRRESRLISVANQRNPTRFASFDGVFVDHRLPLKPGIADLAKAEGGIDLQSIDFSSQSGIDRVNDLLAKKTNGRIASILDPGSAPSLVVANALVFKECWRAPFDKSKTADKPFSRGDGSKVERPTMSMTSDGIGYRSTGRFVAVELPYVDGDFALALVTTQHEPGKITDFKDAAPLLAGIDLADAKVTLSLPKFGASADNELLDALSAMGLKSGLTSTNQLPGFADGLALGRMRQKIWLAVDETGTEAAAVTSAEATRSADQPKVVSVNFDKPFIYALRYRPTGAILMAGYVGDPSEGPSKKD